MEESYFVRVTKPTGWKDEWVMLTKIQAKHIYSEQVELHGADNCVMAIRGVSKIQTSLADRRDEYVQQ
jgi:hypothetical protein